MNFFDFISTLGIFSLTLNQSLMICIGLLLLFLAINKKFEPLLLLPIGFGAILTNIPEIGLSLSPIEKLIYTNNLEHINILLEKLFSMNQDLTILLKDASYTDMIAINNQAQDLGYKPGILYTFYEVAIGSGIAPLLIFMGVSESSVAISIGNAAFFAPEIVTSPCIGLPPIILNASKGIFFLVNGY